MSDHSPWWARVRDRFLENPIRWSVLLVIGLLATWTIGSIWITYTSFDRIDGDTDEAVATLNSISQEAADVTGSDDGDGQQTRATRPEPIPGRTTFLLIGTDSRSGLDDLSDFGAFEGERADVIVLLTVEFEQNEVSIVSLPRDLVAPDLCGRFDEIRLADTFQGCRSIGRETLLVVTVEQMTGISINHVAAIDLEGFQDVVDELGGYEICLDNAVRDSASGLDLPAGCTIASGAETLAWIRSRATEVLIDGRWQTIPLANDLVRNERERRFLVDMFDRIISATNVGQLQALTATVAPHLRLDSTLDLPRLIQTGWNMRLLTRDDIETVAIPVADDTLREMSVLRPTTDISEFLLE